MALRVIYEPRGRAREYADLALTVWIGCPHGCIYCFNHSRPRSRYSSAEEMAAAVKPRANLFDKLRRDCNDLKGDGRPVLLQFMGDPYPPQERDEEHTAKALELMAATGVPFRILTKGGMRAARDFDLYGEGCSFGQTMVFWDEARRVEYEPHASPLEERIAAFQIAKDHGIRTWCSVEPGWEIGEVLLVIHHLRSVVDEFFIGRLNEHPLADTVDWHKFGALLGGYLKNRGGLRYYIKRSLRPYIPKGVDYDTREQPTCPHAKGA